MYHSKAPKYEVREVCHKLKKKQVVTKSVNGYGAIEEQYYFLYENDYLENVDLKTYMKFDVGERLCWDIYIPK